MIAVVDFKDKEIKKKNHRDVETDFVAPVIMATFEERLCWFQYFIL